MAGFGFGTTDGSSFVYRTITQLAMYFQTINSNNVSLNNEKVFNISQMGSFKCQNDINVIINNISIYIYIIRLSLLGVY